MDGGTKRRPISWTDVYLDPAYSDIADLVRESSETLISSLVEARYGRRIARIRQDVRAVSLSPSLAEPLKAEAGSPVLPLVRRYLDASNEAFRDLYHHASRGSVHLLDADGAQCCRDCP